MAQSMRTPLSRVRGLGSAKSGTGDFWRQRLTALALVPLVIIFLFVVISAAGRPYDQVIAILANPFVALVAVLMIVAGVWHMKIGMQVIIEDYLHNEIKLVAQVLNVFFAVAVGGAAVLALLKISFGG